MSSAADQRSSAFGLTISTILVELSFESRPSMGHHLHHHPPHRRLPFGVACPRSSRGHATRSFLVQRERAATWRLRLLIHCAAWVLVLLPHCNRVRSHL